MQRNGYVNFVLTGAKTGETGVFGRHEFVKGVSRVLVSPENAAALLTYLARSYQAFPEGSPELVAAQKRDEENGIRHKVQENSQGADGSPNSIQGDGNRATGTVPDSRELFGSVNASGSPRGEGLVPGGSGHANSGMGNGVESGAQQQSVSVIVKQIQDAVSKLDPTIEEHWSEGGLPSVAYLAVALDRPDLTREIVDQACPAFNRQKAEDIAAL